MVTPMGFITIESHSKGTVAQPGHQFIHSTRKQVMPLSQVVLGERQELLCVEAKG